MFAVWFVLGVILAIPLLLIANRTKAALLPHLYGGSLVIAAVIYIGFAAVWGDERWLLIELAGVLGYGVFYWLGVRHALLWIALGWLLHPLWDAGLHLYGPGTHVVPHWYAILCLAFDFMVAGHIAWKWQLARAAQAIPAPAPAAFETEETAANPVPTTRPPIPGKLPLDMSDPGARKILVLINTVIKRAQREGPVDDMRLELNLLTKALAREESRLDSAYITAWRETLAELETCYAYISAKNPPMSYDPPGPKSWSNSWSGRDDNGVL